MDDSDDGELLTLVHSRPHVLREQESSEGETVAPGKAFATVKGGQRLATSLEFIPRVGESFDIRYAYLPHLWIRRPDTILVEYPSVFTVKLVCAGIDILTRLISDQRLVWVRECTQAEAAILTVAVTSIDILDFYPSRHAGKPLPGIRSGASTEDA